MGGSGPLPRTLFGDVLTSREEGVERAAVLVAPAREVCWQKFSKVSRPGFLH